jgi:hypothetical protein
MSVATVERAASNACIRKRPGRARGGQSEEPALLEKPALLDRLQAVRGRNKKAANWTNPRTGSAPDLPCEVTTN